MRQRTKLLGRINIPGYVCEKCGHTWTKRGDREPRMCPHCKSVNWDQPKKSKEN